MGNRLERKKGIEIERRIEKGSERSKGIGIEEKDRKRD